MVRLTSPFSLLLIWSYILFITRPGELDLREQIAARGNQQPWTVEIGQSILTNLVPQNKLPGMLNTKVVSDYILFTVVWEPNKRSKDHVLIGFLARFIALHKDSLVWTRDNDVLLAAALHTLALGFHMLAQPLAYKLFTFNKRRPWTYVLSTFNTQSIWSLTVNVFMLINTGQEVRNALPENKYPSLTFWFLYACLPGLAALTSSLILDRFASSMGGAGGMLALTAYGTLKIPNSRFLLFGTIRMGCFGLFVLEACQVLSFNPYRSVVALLFEILHVGASAVFLYKLHHPFEHFPLQKILSLTVYTVYGK